MNTTMRRIGKYVKENRKKQQDIAAEVGYTKQKMSNVVNGRVKINADEVIPLCDALGTDPNTLLGWYEPRID